ncbi:hypothetical protein [Actinophytocola glycyrrhizae]|uniref:Uncharacterized protein n=1 Tax=Actinophytocola glycyrrhizae TaxID=2044873 RepID=A0ABV9SD96_9PSEU
MLEQHLAERFRAVVADEPPFRVDPDELVDRLLRAGSTVLRFRPRGCGRRVLRADGGP